MLDEDIHYHDGRFKGHSCPDNFAHSTSCLTFPGPETGCASAGGGLFACHHLVP
jgi:hypothetical protein